MTKTVAHEVPLASGELRGETEVGKLQQIVRAVLLERFLPQAAFSEIRIDPGEDSDGDRVYRIAIVLEPGNERVDGERIVGFVRHLRSKMEEDAFPIVSFISKSDADALKRATG